MNTKWQSPPLPSAKGNVFVKALRDKKQLFKCKEVTITYLEGSPSCNSWNSFRRQVEYVVCPLLSSGPCSFKRRLNNTKYFNMQKLLVFLKWHFNKMFSARWCLTVRESLNETFPNSYIGPPFSSSITLLEGGVLCTPSRSY
jgi:hypothetical protein